MPVPLNDPFVSSLAFDPNAAAILMAMGINELSMSAPCKKRSV